MQFGDGLLGFLLRSHFHKTEAAGAAGHAVLDDVDGEDSASDRKMVLEIIFGGVVVDITNE